MKKLRRLVLAVILLIISPVGAHAQIGPFLDWLHKMSGPRLRMYGLYMRFPFDNNYGQRLGPQESDFLLTALVALQRSTFETTTETVDCLARAYLKSTTDNVFAEREIEAIRGRIQARRADLPGLITTSSVSDPDGLRTLACHIADTLEVTDRSGFRGRIGVFFGDDRHNDGRDSVYVRSLSLQLTGEYFTHVPLSGPRSLHFGFEAGIAGWTYFLSDGSDDFVGVSFPFRLNYYPFAECSSWLLRNVRVGLGTELFLHDGEKFAPAGYPGAEDSEWVFSFFLGWDFSWPSLAAAPRLGCGP